MLINAGTNSGGTVTSAYGIYNNVQTYATTNVGYQQTGTFTKSSDIGMWLANIFTPTSAALIYEISLGPIFNTTSAALTSAAGFYGYSRFNISASNATTIAEQLLNTTFNVSGVGTVTEASVVNINPSINISTASTGTRVTNMYGLKVLPSSVAISTLSTVLGNYCNIYSGTLPTLTGSGKYTTVYGGYFAAPLTTTTDSAGSVALWADSFQCGGSIGTTTGVSGTITATKLTLTSTIKYSNYAFNYTTATSATFTSTPIPYSVAVANYPTTTVGAGNSYVVPVTGLYQLNVIIELNPATSVQYRAAIVTSSNSTPETINFAAMNTQNTAGVTWLTSLPFESTTTNIFNMSGSIVAYLTAGQYVRVYCSGTGDVQMKTYSWAANNFSGYLISL
jgi:hypothetical protein